MSEFVGLLDGLSEQYSSIPARVLVTGLAFAAVAVASWIVHRLRAQVGDRASGAIGDLAVSTVVAAAVAVATAIVLGVWGMAGTVAVAAETAGIGRVAAGRMVLSVGLFVGAFVVVRFIRRFIEDLLGQHAAISEHQVEVTYRITQVSLYVVAGFVVLGVWRVDLSGLLIGAGVLGIVLGMAAQQTLGSIFSGFVLMFSRPFEVGDWVQIGEHEGTVTDITVISTRIQTFDGEYVIIPNDEVSARTITNRSRKGRLRLRVQVGVDYETDLDRAENLIEEATDDLDEILDVPTPQTTAIEFDDSAIVFEIRVWIDNPSARRHWRAKQAVIKSVNEAFKRGGVKIPYPQRELSGRTETGGFQVAMGREAVADQPTPQPDGGDE